MGLTGLYQGASSAYRSRKRKCRDIGRVIFAGIHLNACSSPALAYRPFDGTDAAVADVGEFEVEAQPIGYLKDGDAKFLVAPAYVLNHGFEKNWELVIQGEAHTPLNSYTPESFAANQVFLKHVVREGALQDMSGPSIATEFGVLLPGINTEPGTGAHWAWIVSDRFDWGTVHLNGQAEFSRDQKADLFVSAIIEGPSTWKVRPVSELYLEDVVRKEKTASGLLGFIYQASKDLAYDFAVREAITGDRLVTEIRAGLTFAFPLGDLLGSKHK
jgi:hypothetical protein